MKPQQTRSWGLVVWAVLFLTMAAGPGCREAKPLSPAATAFRQQVKTVLVRLADPLAEPAAKEDGKAVQAVLAQLFALCARDCQDLVDRVVVLDKNGVTISFYPPAKNPEWSFSDYDAVKRAMAGKKPVQAILYRQDGTAIYAICAPILLQEQVTGVMVLIMEKQRVQKEMGLGEQEFLALDFK